MADPSVTPCRMQMLTEDGYPAYVCRRCDAHPGMDAVISDEAWRLIEGDRWGLLCLWCMDELAERAGIQTMVALYFVGRALTSVLPRGSNLPHDWAVTHRRTKCSPASEELLEQPTGLLDDLAKQMGLETPAERKEAK